ncbi:MAG: response regulator [Candidatus Eremiobacteraeota bacterium]|nr:response regulator [Candidatus Eremiobacteraeota bacterium]
MISTNANSTKVILVIENSLPILNYTERILQDHFSVLTFSSVEQALPSLEQADLILSDFQMPGLGGDGLIEHLRQTQMRPLLIMTGLAVDASELEIARELGIPILSKPFSPEALLVAVRAALQL